MRTINSKSIEEYLEFKLVKGGLYEIVSRKHPDYEYIYSPSILDLGKNLWIIPEEFFMTICLDTTKTAVTATATGTAMAMAMATGMATAIQWNLWWNSFIKVLYQEKICLIHVSWLEEISK